MFNCPRCGHLNATTDSQCELCGFAFSPAPEQEPPHQTETPRDLTQVLRPESFSSETDSVEPGSGSASNVSQPRTRKQVRDTLDQMAISGRAHGENEDAGNYIMDPLPVPDTPEKTSPVTEINTEPAEEQESSEQDKIDARICTSCGTQNPPINKFCGSCGQRLPDAAQKAEPVKQPSTVPQPESIYSLICINEDGTDGPKIPLVSDKTTIGRNTDPRFKNDAFLSPAHACLSKTGSTVVLEDQTSLNGTFLRIKGAITVKPGDTFLMGRQVLQLHEMALARDPKDDQGTRSMGSPRPDSTYQLIQVGVGNVAQNIFCLTNEGATIGREEGDIRFAKDRFMSAKHGRIEITADGSLRLLDLDSSNGLWIRLTKPTELTSQDYLFMGQQLFRFHVSE